MKKSAIASIIYPVITLLLLCLIWTVVSVATDNPLLAPSILEVLSSIPKILLKGDFYLSMGATLLRVVVGVAISLLISSCLGYISILNPVGKKIISPIITILRALPTLAITQVLLSWLSPRIAPVVVAVLALVPLFYLNIITPIDMLEGGATRLIKCYQISPRQVGKAYLSQIAPYFLLNVGANISFCIKVVISAEVLSATYVSIGGMMSEQKLYLDVASMVAMSIFAILLALLIEWLCSLVYKGYMRRRGVCL